MGVDYQPPTFTHSTHAYRIKSIINNVMHVIDNKLYDLLRSLALVCYYFERQPDTLLPKQVYHMA